jgi:ATP-dependent Clp protease protease subunit
MREVIIFGDGDDDNDTVNLNPAPRLSHVVNLGVDWARRIIYLDGELESDSGSWFQTMLNYMTDESPVELWLNTPGGDVTSMFAIADSIDRHGQVRIKAYGEVCSAGVLILAAGQKGYRSVAESTVWMSHESTTDGGSQGYRAAKDRRQVDDFLHVHWAKLMAKHTVYTPAWWLKTTEKQAEYWLLGGKAIVEAGMADKVF